MTLSAPGDRPLRPLLPRPESNSYSSDVAPKKGGARVACELCRKRKSKCSGERPVCSICIRRGTKCVYATSSDETHSQALKRKYRELLEREERPSPHKELFDLIKSMSKEEAMETFSRIKAGENVDSILSSLKAGNLLLQLQLVPETRYRYELPYRADMPAFLLGSGSPYLDSMIYEAYLQPQGPRPRGGPATGSRTHLLTVGPGPSISESEYQSQYLKPCHAAVFVDPRLDRAKPSDWTTVSRDDDLMRDLLAAYFTREYHLIPVFQKDYFLEDMANAKTVGRSTECCSSLLVNVVLAYACFCSSKIPNRYKYWDPQSLAYRFLAEAKRIWEVQTVNDGHRNLTSAQAAVIFNVIYNFCGLDKLGNVYSLQGLAIAQELKLFDGNGHIQSQRMRHARNFTAWALYNQNSMNSWHFFNLPFLSKPPAFALPDPFVNPTWYGEIWTRYPLNHTLSPTYFGHIFKATCDFRVILNDLCSASFGEGTKLLTMQAVTFVDRFRGWYINLPSMLLPNLDYHIILMTLCQPFVDEDWTDGFSPRTIIADADRNLNILMRLYYLRHGFEAMDVYLVSPLAKLGFMSLNRINDQLSQQELDDVRSTLFLALKGLRDQGRNHVVARTVYRLIQNQLRPEEARLVRDLEDLGEAPDEAAAYAVEIQSNWMPSSINISDDPVVQGLSKMAEKFLKLDSDEGG